METVWITEALKFETFCDGPNFKHVTIWKYEYF